MSKKKEQVPKVPKFYDFTECRLNHRWVRTATPKRVPSWGYLISYECEGCGAIRNDTIDSNGNLSTRQYVYPAGYKLEAGVVKADFRMHLIEQFTKKELGG